MRAESRIKEIRMNHHRRIRTTAEVQLRAKELRQEQTSIEDLLWKKLRNRQLHGFKFRRQAPLGPFIADFYCAVCRLVIEIDGGIHLAQTGQDQQRTQQFEAYGYRVIRFRNEAIEQNMPVVIEGILRACLEGENSETAEG